MNERTWVAVGNATTKRIVMIRVDVKTQLDKTFAAEDLFVTVSREVNAGRYKVEVQTPRNGVYQFTIGSKKRLILVSWDHNVAVMQGDERTSLRGRAETWLKGRLADMEA